MNSWMEDCIRRSLASSKDPDDRDLPFVDTENGVTYRYPEWQPSVYSSGSGVIKRKKPSKKVREEILIGQGHQCIYCGNSFGAYVWHNGCFIQLGLQWDHYIPYSYQNNNRGFVAACHVCNKLKSNKMFDTLADARRYLAERWCAKGYTS